MAYSTNTNDGQTIPVPDGNNNVADLSLILIGRNSTNYGNIFVQNTVRHLENFASLTPPTPNYTPTGQMWYDKTTKVMRVQAGPAEGNVWKTVNTFIVSTTDPTTHLIEGTGYVNSFDDHLKIYDGANWRNAVLPGGTVTSLYAGNAAIGTPSNYGTKVETLYLSEANTSVVVPVLALKYVSDSTVHSGITADPAHSNANATIMAIFSEREFYVSSSDPNYSELWDGGSNSSISSHIVRGMNLRKDYTDTIVSQASTSEWADKANTIMYLGSPVQGDNVIHTGRGYIPDIDGIYTIGNTSSSFAHIYTDDLTLGRANSISSINIRGTVDIGDSSNTVNHIYTKDLTVTGNLDFSGINDLTNLENAAITNVTLTSGTISSAPTTSNDIANKAYVDAQSATATASNLTLLATNTTNATHYPLFASSATGATAPRTDTGFTYNPSTGNLSTTGYFVGTATQARYADLAEKYLSDKDYGPGTVVKIGGDKEITQTTDHADTEVFGVISTDPAYLMNANSKGLPVALQGRVPVRVIGTIKKGERLVSSEIPGVAWGVANDDVSIQAIIGRSLVDKDDSGLGVIEAVIGVK